MQERGPIELSRADLAVRFPFFGEKTLFVDSITVERTETGEVGSRAIGIWVVREDVTAEHFRDFTGQDGREVSGLGLLPGHFWAEILGQALGALVSIKYPDRMIEVLPTFTTQSSSYREAAFPGDRVNLCVEFTGEPVEEKGRLTFFGRGAAVFNDRTLAVVDQIAVRILPLAVGIRALEMTRSRHQGEEWVPASFDKFPKYFGQQ